jgi:hypothetical protein
LRILRSPSDLVQLAPPDETVHVAFHAEKRHSLVVAAIQVCGDDDQVRLDAVGDEGLRAGDAVEVSLPLGFRLHSAEV